MLRILIAGALLLPAVSSYSGPKNYNYQRIYKPGDSYGYDLKTELFQNGQSGSVTEARSRHTVVKKPNLKEAIRFERLVRRSGDENLDLKEEIKALPTYHFSAATNARKKDQKLPSFEGLKQPVVGAIADLQTFLLSASPAVGANRLHKIGQIYKSPTPQVGAWADGTKVLVGQDCILIQVKLTGLTKENAAFETTFSVPEKPCQDLKLAADWMKEPVDPETSHNNFQQILSAGERLHVMWGRERFVVKTVVRRKDGQILSGSMDNQLLLMMKVGCDKNLKNCTGSMPLRLDRKLTLTPAK